MDKRIDTLSFNKEEGEKDKLSKTFADYLIEINYLIEKAEKCQELINNYDNLSDMKFYQEIKELGIDNELHGYDYANIVSLVNHEKYHGPMKIKTNMKVLTGNISGHGKDAEYYKEDRGVSLIVLYTETLNKDGLYTKEDIDLYLNSGKIVILAKEVEWFRSYYGNGEYCPNYGIKSIDGNIYREFIDYEGKYYKATIKYIKKKFNKDRLKFTKNKLMEIIKKEMDIMLSLEKQFNEKKKKKRIGELENK